MSKYTKEYFRHDYNARTDEKIIRLVFNHDWKGYGLYWAIVELIYIGGGKIRNDYTMIAHELRTDPHLIEKIVKDYDLFYERDGQIKSKAITKRLEERKGVSDTKSVSANKRWDKERKNKSKATNEVGEKVNEICDKTPIPPMREPDAYALQTECKSNASIEQNRIEQNRTVTTPMQTASEGMAFNEFWVRYPKKVARGAAMGAWAEVSPPVQECLTTLAWQVKSPDWTKENGKYIPSPENWIRNQRWHDMPSGSQAPAVYDQRYTEQFDKQDKYNKYVEASNAFHDKHTKGGKCHFCGAILKGFDVCKCEQYVSAHNEIKRVYA